MTLVEIAQRIPSEYRREILLTNMINKAQAVSYDPSMYFLFTIWKNYVENDDDLKLECNACLERVLNNYRQIVDALVTLEKANDLLSDV